ncbi:MAG: hypothetical protein BGP12_11640 [Rhodospirillales bacterium 70-18]|nr:MAG: hypothetical protein BGP12_11640 [Rhodospirillales bacterium 70-18]
MTYRCEACDQPIGEHYETAMLAAGEWRATVTAQDSHTVGFHISALCSPVGRLSCEQIARDWEMTHDKPQNVIVVAIAAIAWELAAFIWSIAHMVEPPVRTAS